MPRYLPIAVILIAVFPFATTVLAQPEAGTMARIAQAATTPEARELIAASKIEVTPEFLAALLKEGTAHLPKEPQQAELLFRTALDLAEQTHDSRSIADANYRLGILLYGNLAYPEAEKTLRRALETANQLGDARLGSDVARSLAMALREQGQMARAQTVILEAIDLAKRENDDERLGRALTAAGSIAMHTGNVRAAIQYLQLALGLAEKLKSLQGQAAVLNNLGTAYHAEFDEDDAVSYLERSLLLKRQLGPSSRPASTMNNLGVVALSRNRFDEAERYFRQTVEATQDPRDATLRGTAWVNLGLVSRHQNNLPQSRLAYQQGLAIADSIGDIFLAAEAHLGLGKEAGEAHRYDEAAVEIAKARALTEEAGIPELLIRVMEASGELERAQDHADRARTAYEEAIRQVEALRLNVGGDERTQADFQTNESDLWQGIIGIEVSTGRLESAFRYSEASKSRVLLDVLSNGHEQLARFLTPAEAARNSGLLAQIAALHSKLQATSNPQQQRAIRVQTTAAQRQYSEFRTTEYALHPELAARDSNPEPLSLSRAAELIPDETTAFLSYSVGATKSYAFVLLQQAGKPVLRVRVLNVSSAKLKEQVELWKSQISARELGFATLSSQLYATLLDPVHADLTGKTRVIVFPDGPLWELPFEALRGPSGKFLIEEFELFLAPSVTVLARMQSTRLRRTGAETLLALGDPAGDLPEAKDEVAAIAKLFGQSRSKVYVGAEARNDTFFSEAGSYALLHVAAHGAFNDANPLYSYISLAAGKRPGSDGDMEAREIMDLRLTARLAVLAGCETGKTTGSGEGLAGMAWAFFVAGTPATVASLWKVESRSTAELMTNLYGGLAHGVAISASLREAKLKLMRKPEYRHPFYWAGFVGIGAGY